jgi:hypothetical protein
VVGSPFARGRPLSNDPRFISLLRRLEAQLLGNDGQLEQARDPALGPAEFSQILLGRCCGPACMRMVVCLLVLAARVHVHGHQYRLA